MREQLDMFPEYKNDIDKEWVNMPEFNMQDLEPVKQVIISFKTWEDMKSFAKLIEQPLTAKTQSVWYPKAEIDRAYDKIYTSRDES
jgi:hypothetical protein